MKNLLATLTHYKALKARAAEIESELDAMKAEIVEIMGDEKKLTCGQYVVTRTECAKTSIDEKRLRAERPDVAEEYARTTTYERFTVR